MKLKKITIDKFRGATQPFELELSESKNVTMIFGENGCGKSTLSDALITCLSNGSDYGSLNDKSILHKEKLLSLASTTSTLSDILISIETDTHTYLTTCDGKVFTTDQLEDLPKLNDLRRSQIDKLINAKPAERYAEISHFIDVDDYLKNEVTLTQAIKLIVDDNRAKLDTIEKEEAVLEKDWIDTGSQDGSWRVWIKRVLGKNLSDSKKLLQDHKEINSTWLNIKNQNVVIQNQIKIINDNKVTLEKNKIDIDKIIQEEGQSNLVSALDAALTFVNKISKIEECPICSQKVDHDALKKSLSDRIASMKTLKELLSSQKKLQTSSKSSQDIITDRLLNIQNSIKSIKILVDSHASIESKALDAYIDSINKAKNNRELYSAIYQSISQKLKEDFESLSQKEKELNSEIEQHELIKNSFEAHKASEEKILLNDARLLKLNWSLDLMTSIRKEFIDNQLNSITDEVDRLYSEMHPGEEIGNLSLFLQPKKRNSLDVKAKFYGHDDISPQALYSESHIDTLGLCIMIALAKKDDPGRTVLILDDVLTSVDDEHLKRFVTLIHEEARHFGHVFLTSHYQPWKHLYKYGHEDKSKMNFIELKPWSLETGIQYLNSKTIIDELEALLNLGHYDRQSIVAKCGVIIEHILNFLSKKYRGKVPYQDVQSFTIGTLIDSFGKNVRKVLRSEIYDSEGMKIDEIDLGNLIQEFTKYSTRNTVGAHYNEYGLLVGDTEVSDFVSLTKRLIKATICIQSGELPVIRKSGSYWEPKSGSIRLYPLSA